ncbi:MAG: SDR family oxidoreductase [Bacteroidetes bacterium]|nr:MAG: SDR family oxidoreductase [Bacteroidota bacterium]
MKNKTIIITGASSGIGEATAYAFASRGANLVLASRNIDKLEIVANACRKLGVEAISILCDVGKEEDCKRLIAETIHKFGKIDVLVNNAGISMRAMLNECSIEVIKQVMDINFWGSVYCTKHALPYLLQRKGSVISVSSVSGIVGLPARTGYSASKFALDGFMQSLRIETLHQGLHVGIVYPGYTASNIRNAALNKDGKPQQESPLNENKLMPASKVADTIVKLAVKRKRQKILTNLGHLSKWLNTFFPSWVDRMVYSFVSKEKDSPFK